MSRRSGINRRSQKWRILIREALGPGEGTLIFDYGSEWRYKTESQGHSSGFQAPAFDDSSWTDGDGAFGYVDPGHTDVRLHHQTQVWQADEVETLWADPTPSAPSNACDNSDMALRMDVVLPAGTEWIRVEYGVDDEVWFYLDGTQIEHREQAGPSHRGAYFFDYEVAGGTYVLAVRARNKATTLPLWTNAAYFDAKLTAFDGPIVGDRRPGDVIAIVDNAQNVGVSELHNSAGELHFTLNTLDAKAPLIEPWKVHWAFEVARGEGWRELNAGWIVDIDSQENDTIFYGLDYLGILSLLFDERFNPEETPDKAALLWPEDPALYPDVATSGSKYVERTITEIVTDQLQRAIHAPNSPVGFFELGTVASMTEEVTIFATLAERLAFIVGLLDSHRAGTGKRTRLRVRKLIDGGHEFVVEENPGDDRPDLKLEYGALVQGYRIVPFGDFGTRVLALGRETNGLLLKYHIEDTYTGAVLNENLYGRLPKLNLWPDIVDLNDLKRRAKQYAGQVSAIGKRVGLGLRTNILAVKDNWDIADSVPIDIQRGPVDTTSYGSGLWTIWGWALEIKSTTQEIATLSLLPKIAETTLDPDITGSSTTSPTPPIVIDDEPPGDEPASGSGIWIDTTTGIVYIVDPDTGFWVDSGLTLGAPLTVEEDGGVSVSAVSRIIFEGLTVSEDSAGIARVVLTPLTVEEDGGDTVVPVTHIIVEGAVVTDEGSGVARIAIATLADATLVWMPLTTVVAGAPELVWDGDDSLIPTLTPF